MPYCGLCSHVGIIDAPDILIGPRCRPFRGSFKLVWCCQQYVSETLFESEAECSAWWRKRRQEPLDDIASDNRRRNTLAKLSAANLEPIL